MICPRCQYEWEPRKPSPLKCPHCQNPCTPYKRKMKPKLVVFEDEQPEDSVPRATSAIIVDIPEESAIIEPKAEIDPLAERKAMVERLMKGLK